MEITKQQEYWDVESSTEDYFRDYLAVAVENDWVEMLLNVERKLGVQVSGDILEIGGGSQFLSRFLCPRKNTHVICTDISEQRIKLSNLYYKSAPDNLQTLGNINAQQLPFADEQFDFIIGDAVLHHIEDLRSALYELNRCLKPGGQAVFIREPVLGMDVILKRKIKDVVNKKKYDQQKLGFLVEHRFEFEKYMFQWYEEFYRAGFQHRTFKGWYYKRPKDIFKSRFPHLMTTSVTFHLSKAVDTKKLSIQNH